MRSLVFLFENQRIDILVFPFIINVMLTLAVESNTKAISLDSFTKSWFSESYFIFKFLIIEALKYRIQCLIDTYFMQLNKTLKSKC